MGRNLLKFALAAILGTMAAPLCAQVTPSPPDVIDLPLPTRAAAVADESPGIVIDEAHGPNTPVFTRYDALLASLTIFALAVFIGFELIAKVPPTLHTPLMSGSNAISGITIVGAILVTGHSSNIFVSFLGMLAVVLAMVNVVGGFLVTHRMLAMFKRKK